MHSVRELRPDRVSHMSIVPEVSPPPSMLFRDAARRRSLLKPVKRDWLLRTAVYRCVQHHTALCFQHYV